jgi:hypothetical protein
VQPVYVGARHAGARSKKSRTVVARAAINQVIPGRLRGDFLQRGLLQRFDQYSARSFLVRDKKAAQT